MNAPRFLHGQLVRIVGVVRNGEPIRFVLGGKVDEVCGQWLWRIPEHVARATALGSVFERSLALVSDDGLAPVRWEDCAWRPTDAGCIEAAHEIIRLGLHRARLDDLPPLPYRGP